MNPNKRFEVMYIEEAIKFLNTLDVKVKDKIKPKIKEDENSIFSKVVEKE